MGEMDFVEDARAGAERKVGEEDPGAERVGSTK
jgi:hypothetical protein